MRRVLLWVGLGLLAALLLAGLWGAWVLNTERGRDFVLDRAISGLPEGTLEWEHAEGPLTGPLTLRGVRYRSEDGLEVEVGTLYVDPRLGGLLGRTMELRRLRLDDVVVRLGTPPDVADDEPTDWDEMLAQLDLPVDIVVQDLQVRNALILGPAGDQLVHVESLDAQGELSDSRLAISRLDVRSDVGDLTLRGDLDTARAFATSVEGTLQLPSPEGQPEVAGPRFDVRVEGDRDDLALVVEGVAPEPLVLSARIREVFSERPEWDLSLDAQGIDPHLFGAEEGERIALQLTAQGVGTHADIQGFVERDDLRIDIAPSTVGWDDGVLALAPLTLELLEGEVRLEGTVGLADEDARVDVRLLVDGVRYRPAPEEPVLAVDGQLALQGTLDAWQVEGGVDFVRAEETARLVIAGRGDQESLRLQSFRAEVPGGLLEGSAEVTWSPALSWEAQAQLQDFDPGYFEPDFSGRITARIQTTGEVRDEGAIDARFQLDQLGGHLRERALSGEASLDWRGDAGELAINLGIGGSRVRGGGAVGDVLGLAFEFDPLHLQDVWPDASGRLQGELSLQGEAAAPDIAADLRGQALRFGDEEIGSLRVRGELPGTGTRGNLVANLEAVVLGGIALEVVQAQVEGSLEDATVGLQARGEPGALELSADVRRGEEQISGQLRALRYAPPRGAEWSLQNPAAFRQSGEDFGLEPACLRAAGTASLCLEADWPRSASVEGESIPLAMIEPWLEQQLDFQVDGLVNLQAQMEQGPAGLVGRATVRSDGGGVRLAQIKERELFTYQRLELDAAVEEGDVTASLDLRLSGDDYLRATLQTGLEETAALDATVDVMIRDLAFVELFSPDIIEPQGELSGNLRATGTRVDPRVEGQAGLRNLTVELPALGIELRDSEVLVQGDATGQAMLSGTLRSGEGEIVIEGTLAEAFDDERALELTVRGQDFLIADLPELRAIVAPDMTVALSDDTLRVRGEVTVPTALINLERLETTTRPSADVVVLDPVEEREEGVAGLLIDALVSVVLGDGVELVGFGLEGGLSGQIRVREMTGRPTVATGALTVTGEYTAYGQDLTLERGRLAWSASAIENPSLDIIAQRVVDTNVTVGIRIRGTALAPTTEVFSDPAMDSTEALSWLVIGRPLHRASADEGQELSVAAMALGAGGNLLAEQLGARLGLDEAGVSDSRALGGAVFSIGKYLSPRLLVSYGVSLVGQGQVLTLKYLLGRGFDIEIESGTESRAALNWRIER